MVKKKVRRGNRKSKPRVVKNRISLVLNKILLFAGLFVVSFFLLQLSKNPFWINFFKIMAIVFGFVAVGFLIALLILWVMKIIQKK